MKNNVLKIFVSLFFCAIVLAPGVNATNLNKESNTLKTIEPNAPIQLKVQTFHLNLQDSWVRPYIITTKGHIGKWDISGYTYYKVGNKVGAEYYHASGVILPRYTHFWGHKHVIRHILGGEYTGKIWTRPNSNDMPYELYEIHTTFNAQCGSQTTIKKIIN